MRVMGKWAARMPSLSFMKVEKVVKPPQKPVVSNRRTCGVSQPCVEGNDEKKPISRQPRILTVKVPSGNGVATTSDIPFATR